MKKQSVFILGTIIALSAFFRLYRLSALMPFTIDEEYISQLAWTIKQDFHIIWIGVSAGSTNYYLGPGYIYFTALLYTIAQGNPLVLGLVSSVLGVVTTLVLYWFTKSISNEKIAQAATFIYASSTYIALYDRRFWPPPLGLVGLLMLWTITAARKKPVWYVAMAALIGLSLHLHLSLLLFIPFAIYALFVSFRAKQLHWPVVLGMTGAYLTITSPLLVYDLLHNADNLKAPFTLLSSQGGSLLPSLSTHVITAMVVLARVWNSSVALSSFDALLYVFISLLAIALCLRPTQHPTLKTVGGVIAMFLIAFMVYPGRIQEYYLAGMLPFMAIAMGLLLLQIPRLIRILVIIAYLTANIFALYTVTEPQSLSAKLNLIHRVQAVTKQQPIALTTKEDYRLNGGWHFLFMTEGTSVVEGSAQPLFGWIYQQYAPHYPKPKHRVVIEYTDTGFRYKL